MNKNWPYKYFTPEEVLGEDGLKMFNKGHLLISPCLLRLLDSFREYLNKPIIVTSGYRSPEENIACGGARFSRHVQGLAVDVKIPGMAPKEVAREAFEYGFNYTKTYPTWTHLDIRYKHGN